MAKTGRPRQFERLGQYCLYLPPEQAARIETAAWFHDMNRTQMIRHVMDLWLEGKLAEAPDPKPWSDHAD